MLLSLGDPQCIWTLEQRYVAAGHILTEWQILRPSDAVMVARGTSEFRQPGWDIGDHAALVTLLNTGLRALSVDLIAILAGLGE